jgi:hypothetical protein
MKLMQDSSNTSALTIVRHFNPACLICLDAHLPETGIERADWAIHKLRTITKRANALDQN